MTNDEISAIAWAILMMIQLIIRKAFFNKYAATEKASIYNMPKQKTAVFFLSLGYMYLPLFYMFIIMFNISILIKWFDVFKMSRNILINIIGAVILFLGCLLFLITHIALKNNWSPYLELNKEHKLITTGVYSIVRHPMYTSFMLTIIGNGLILANWFILGFGLAVSVISYIIRLDDEERMMEDYFGDEYREYKKKTPKRIIPFVL